MKITQWLAVLVALAAVVFVVTFAGNYLNTDASNIPIVVPPAEEELPTLEFKEKIYPLMTDDPKGKVELEHKQMGYHDFWFENPNDQPVRLGAISKACKCQGAKAYVLKADYKPNDTHAALMPMVAGAGVTKFRGEAQEPPIDEITDLNPNDPTGFAEIPAHRFGWVRMTWTGEKSGPMTLFLNLWMHHKDSGLNVRLERHCLFLDPIRILEGDVKLGYLKADVLPLSRSFVCWSSTRSKFKITKADVERALNMTPKSDPFLVGEPVELTADERREIEKAMQSGQVSCAYRIPVTLAKAAPDGTSFELGSFRRKVEVMTDAQDWPVTVTFTGVVHGDVVVGSGEDAGNIDFGFFPRGSDVMRFKSLQSNADDIKLEIDSSRLPPFLNATLTDESEKGGLGKRWRLEVRVLATASGPFPREGADAAYRDCAIYLKTAGANTQTVRIPVKGDAVAR